MFIVVGLGNPGREYARTRHNVGFDVIDVLSEKHHIQLTKNAMHGQIGEGFVGGEKLVLVKPQTFMNLSGQCVTELVSWYKPEMDHLLLIYDDIDLPLTPAKLIAAMHGAEPAAPKSDGKATALPMAATTARPMPKISAPCWRRWRHGR